MAVAVGADIMAVAVEEPEPVEVDKLAAAVAAGRVMRRDQAYRAPACNLEMDNNREGLRTLTVKALGKEETVECRPSRVLMEGLC